MGNSCIFHKIEYFVGKYDKFAIVFEHIFSKVFLFFECDLVNITSVNQQKCQAGAELSAETYGKLISQPIRRT